MKILYYNHNGAYIRFVEKDGIRYFSTYDISKASGTSRANMTHYLEKSEIITVRDRITGKLVKFRDFSNDSYCRSCVVKTYLDTLYKDFKKSNIVSEDEIPILQKQVDIERLRDCIHVEDNKPYFMYTKLFIPLGNSYSFTDNRVRHVKDNFVTKKIGKHSYCDWENLRKMVLTVPARKTNKKETPFTRLYNYCRENKVFKYKKFEEAIIG